MTYLQNPSIITNNLTNFTLICDYDNETDVENGTVKAAPQVQLFVDFILINSHQVCVLVGVPLNLMIIIAITCRRKLHQPRKVIWIGIALSNLFILTNQIIETFAFYSSNETGCRIRTVLVGLPYVALLVNQFISLIDRYLCISHSIWYQTNVTVPWILGVQLCIFILLCFLMKGHYIFGFTPVSCIIYPTDRKVFFGFIFASFLLCVIGQIVVYLKAKSDLILGAASGSSQHRQERSEIVTFSVIRREEDGQISTQPMDDIVGVTIHPICGVGAIRNSTVSQFEMEATRNVIIGVGSLCMFATPWLISSALLLGCAANIQSGQRVVDHCGNYGWAASYTRELFVIHSVYHSIFYSIRSRDFC